MDMLICVIIISSRSNATLALAVSHIYAQDRDKGWSQITMLSWRLDRVSCDAGSHIQAGYAASSFQRAIGQD